MTPQSIRSRWDDQFNWHDTWDKDLSQMLGGGLKGKVGSFAMKHAMKRQANKMKKAKKKRK